MSNRHIIEEIPILSWNVHDITDQSLGIKTSINEFQQVLKSGLIFCLQETKAEVQLPEYLCFNKLRSKSRSGGLCIGVHRSISDKVRRVLCDCEDILAIKIPTSITQLNKDLILINVYDSPPNSSYKIKQTAAGANTDVIDQLIDFAAGLNNKSIMLAGDLNARTGNLNSGYCVYKVSQNFTNHDLQESGPMDSTIRTSKDKIKNERGNKLLDMLGSCNLTLLNGSTIGDACGEFTSFQYNGASVVDYIATSPELLEDINRFSVMSLTQFSDHCPLLCALNLRCRQIKDEIYASKLLEPPKPTKWSSEASAQTFQNTQDEEYFQNKILDALQHECHTLDDVIKLNASLTNTLVELGEKSCSSSNPKQKTKKRIKPKNRWFDASCILLKRELGTLAKKYGKDPTNAPLRFIYYTKKKEYKAHIKRKKYLYFKEINCEILQDNNISWKDFKRLKEATKAEPNLDLYDIETFYIFFSSLYGKRQLSTDYRKNNNEQHQSHNINNMLMLLQEILNKDVKPDEVSDGVKNLKNGKAAGEDMILNEFLKNCKEDALLALTKLFNECLRFEVYPWNTTLITPLHKKGCPHDPDNYRAIAVGSNIGKLFSTILLNRLLEFRSIYCPDTPNQRGFCKGAQTSDHIFSLNTCIEKYVKRQRKRLYSCFVDFQKAFDTVSREALLYKLGQLGVQGRFFGCLRHMYTNSSAKLKMVKKLSECFDIKAGTEQGHPLSPELFKCYIHELSKRLNCLQGTENPLLNNVRITHLLWADDLVLLALTKDSLQLMIDELYTFCAEWGLKVNIKKTAVLVFNFTGRKLLESTQLQYGCTPIPSVREYCYLGTCFTISGSLKANQTQLRKKGLRAYFSLKNTIDLSSIAKAAVFKLFDSLILPVVSYGCQVWLTRTELLKCISPDNTKNAREVLKAISQDPMENLHLSLMKWTMGVRKNTTNIPIWGDCGRCPIGVQMIKLLIDFHNRLTQLDDANSAQIVRHAFAEQRSMGLEWYRTTQMLYHRFDPEALARSQRSSKSALPNSTLVKKRAEEWFKGEWNQAREQSRKLIFYNAIKKEHGFEPYLHLQKHKKAKFIAWLRSSSHFLNNETGRYGLRYESQHHRACNFCSTEDKELLQLLANLPTVNLIIEDEEHFIRDCPRYGELRSELSLVYRELLTKRDYKDLFSEDHVIETAKYIQKLSLMRYEN